MMVTLLIKFFFITKFLKNTKFKQRLAKSKKEKKVLKYKSIGVDDLFYLNKSGTNLLYYFC